jgi:hypothetical protein
MGIAKTALRPWLFHRWQIVSAAVSGSPPQPGIIEFIVAAPGNCHERHQQCDDRQKVEAGDSRSKADATIFRRLTEGVAN